MDLEDLRAFIKVAELASFSRAGEQLGSSKSRVSLRVSALEAQLGSQLLQRSTRGPADAGSLAAGTLVEILPALRSEPMPISLVHARNVPRRVRVLMSWLAQLVEPLLSEHDPSAKAM